MYLLVAEADLVFQSANIPAVGKDIEQLEMVLKRARKYQIAEKNTFIKDRKLPTCLANGKKIKFHFII